MARKDIPDALVIFAMLASKEIDHQVWPYDILMQWTGEPEKVCCAAMERACDKGLVEFGVSLRTGWPTDKGLELIQVRHDTPTAS